MADLLAPRRLAQQELAHRLAVEQVLLDDLRDRLGGQVRVVIGARPDGHIRREVAAILAAAYAQIDIVIELPGPQLVLQCFEQLITTAGGAVWPAAEIDSKGFLAVHSMPTLV